MSAVLASPAMLLDGGGLPAGTVAMALGGLVVYFIPTIIAVAGHHPRRLLIGLINLFLGWTIIGWLVALALLANRGRRRDFGAQITYVPRPLSPRTATQGTPSDPEP